VLEPLEVILDDLARSGPSGLAGRRRKFWQDRGSFDALLDLRVELLLGSALARRHVIFTYSQASPDIVCEVAGSEWGLEVTARRRDDLAALHDALEKALTAGADVGVLIRRLDERFKFDASRVPEIVGAVVDAVNAGRTSLAFGWAGIAVDIRKGGGMGPGLQVVWEPVTNLAAHWPAVARELTSRVQEKSSKQYPVPTVAVVDITRLGESGRWALETIPAATLTSEITPKLAGTLAGVAIVRAGFLQSAGFELVATWANPKSRDCGAVFELLRAVSQPALPLAVAERVHSGGSSGPLRQWIGDQLRAISEQRSAELRSGTRRFADDEQADAFLRTDPFALLIGILCQQWRTRAGRAWEVPWRIQQHLGHMDPRQIASETPTIRRDLGASGVARPRMIEIVVRAAERVAASYSGDAQSIWAAASAREITDRVREFHGAGPKISSMAPSIIRAISGAPAVLDGEIAVDGNVTRVFSRTGLVAGGAAGDDIRGAARVLSRDAPGELDLGTWVIGSEICTAKNPACYRCPLLPGCRRVGV
jgi:endonuclease III